MDHQTVATSICQRLQNAGFVAYFAGGWVRDLVMEHPSSDIDIATNATAAQVADLFGHTIPVGIAFESLVVVEGEFHFEVSSFRQDVAYTDGRKPDAITLATPEEDAQRRDFTINGMFYDPVTEKIYDYVNGHEDIERRVVRAIGDADERFREDRLRMIRGVRMAARFDFELEATTRQAIREQAATLFPSVAMERVWQELEKMRAYPRFDQAILMLFDLGLLAVIFPGLAERTREELERAVEAFTQMPKEASPLIFILKLFPSLADLEDLCRTLRVSNRVRQQALLYRRGLDLLEGAVESVDWARYYAQKQSWVCVEAIAASYPASQQEAFLEEHRARKLRLESAIQRIQSQKPLVSAADLINRGVARGPLLGALLREAERIAVNEALEDGSAVMQRLEQSVLWAGASDV